MTQDGKSCAWIAVSFAAGLAAVLVLGSVPREADARTGVSTTESTCSCACICLFKSCQCESYPDGTSSCNTACWACLGCPNGFAGGGTVQLDTRQATLAIFATAEKENKNKLTGGTGLLRWFDPNFEGAALTLESVGLNNYRILDRPNARAVTGYVVANGAGPYPFQLEVVAEPAGGQDSVALTVGDAVGFVTEFGFSYTATGPLVTGDLIGTWTPPTE